MQNNHEQYQVVPPLTAEEYETLKADIVEHGAIEPTEALPAEMNETALLHLPRLRLWFDRRSLGRLRMMVDVINREG